MTEQARSLRLAVGQAVYLRGADTRKAAVCLIERIEWLPRKTPSTGQWGQVQAHGQGQASSQAQMECWVRVYLATDYYDWSEPNPADARRGLKEGSSIGVPAYRIEEIRQ